MTPLKLRKSAHALAIERNLYAHSSSERSFHISKLACMSAPRALALLSRTISLDTQRDTALKCVISACMDGACFGAASVSLRARVSTARVMHARTYQPHSTHSARRDARNNA
jgi:hypothetical protein